MRGFLYKKVTSEHVFVNNDWAKATDNMLTKLKSKNVSKVSKTVKNEENE